MEQSARNLGVSTSVSALKISDLPLVSVPAAGVILVKCNHLINAIDKTARDDLRISTPISALAINDFAPVSSVPVIGIDVNVRPNHH